MPNVLPQRAARRTLGAREGMEAANAAKPRATSGSTSIHRADGASGSREVGGAGLRRSQQPDVARAVQVDQADGH